MFSRQSPIVALAVSVWKLAGAWWKVDRIRVPRSRCVDCGETLEDEVLRNVASQERRLRSDQHGTVDSQPSTSGERWA